MRRVGLTTWDQATLLQRVWGVDALKCEGCGGRMKFIAVIKDRAVIERILKHLGEETEEPLVREGEGPLRRVGLKVGWTRGERGVREGDVCAEGARGGGDGFGQRGSGRVSTWCG